MPKQIEFYGATMTADDHDIYFEQVVDKAVTEAKDGMVQRFDAMLPDPKDRMIAVNLTVIDLFESAVEATLKLIESSRDPGAYRIGAAFYGTLIGDDIASAGGILPHDETVFGKVEKLGRMFARMKEEDQK